MSQNQRKLLLNLLEHGQ